MSTNSVNQSQIETLRDAWREALAEERMAGDCMLQTHTDLGARMLYDLAVLITDSRRAHYFAVAYPTQCPRFRTPTS